MKTYVSVVLAVFVVILSACSSTATPVQEVATEEVSPTQASVSNSQKFYPLATETGNADIDVVLSAVASRESQELINLFGYTTTACKTVNALGGPPPCREGEAEGTMVEVLPFLGSEGSYFWKDEVDNFSGLNVIGLYAVYHVPATVFSDANYPAGDYAIAYIGEDNLPEVVLQIADGKIVRIDYIFGYPEYNNFLTQDITDFILEPLK